MVDLLLPPFAAAMVILLTHAYFVLRIMQREVIFVDLALAQIAALGATVAFVNNTVYGNEFGIAAEAETSFPILRNSIFAKNTTGITAPGQAIGEGGYNDYFSNTQDFDGPVGDRAGAPGMVQIRGIHYERVHIPDL